MNGGEMRERHFVVGSHSDYYLLLDEQSDRIFTSRLAEHMREAHDIDPAAGGLPEIWMDHKGRRVWYVFQASRNSALARLPATGHGGFS
jgi:hypothetical protein